MLTGDKLETAVTISMTAGLISVPQEVYTIASVKDLDELDWMLQGLEKKDVAPVLVIDGDSFHLAWTYKRVDFIRLATRSPTVIFCRCSPI